MVKLVCCATPLLAYASHSRIASCTGHDVPFSNSQDTSNNRRFRTVHETRQPGKPATVESLTGSCIAEEDTPQDQYRMLTLFSA